MKPKRLSKREQLRNLTSTTNADFSTTVWPAARMLAEVVALAVVVASSYFLAGLLAWIFYG